MEDALQQIKQRIEEVTPLQAKSLQMDHCLLIDIREDSEVGAGMPEGALHIPKSFLEIKIQQFVKDRDQTFVLMCAGGTRSAYAASMLQFMGFTNAKSMEGGFNRWKDEGHPITIPKKLTTEDQKRYARHLMMNDVGEAGQIKLLESKVLVVGAGGIGSPVAYYLAAAGVGTLGIIDHDVVDMSNLQRQILHTEARVGEKKVESAKAALTELNSSIDIQTHDCRLNKENIDQIVEQYDLVVDGSDNFPTRYLINDACVKHGIPNVHGAVYQFEGYVTVYDPKHSGGCYRCIYPEPLPQHLAPNCAEAGVLGVLPGIIGLLEAVEAIKILLDIGEALRGKMLCYNALDAKFTTLSLEKSDECQYCNASATAYPEYIDYEHFCSLHS